MSLYWDSCVFIRYLTGGKTDACYEDICQFVDEAKRGVGVKIYTSTLALAEIRPRHLRQGRIGSINDMLNDFRGSVELIDPSPNIMIWAGALKDAQATNPGDPRQEPNRVRVVGTPDAIHLATCLYARDTLAVSDIIFHTLDEGKGSSWEGKSVPLLGFERWYPEQSRGPHVEKVCGLTRTKPVHPRPTLSGIASHVRTVDLGSSKPLGEA